MALNTIWQKVIVSLFSIRRNFHRMWRQSLCWREKLSKSKVSADWGQKWMCVSVSAEWQCGNWFTQGDRGWRKGNIHFGERILFRKSKWVSYGSNEIDVLSEINYIDVLENIRQNFKNKARVLRKRMMRDLRNA